MSAAPSPFAARRAAVLLAMTVALVACRRSAPEAPPTPKAAPGVVEVLKGGRWLFTYVEPSGTFATTDKPESVPEIARAMVRVFDPADPGKTDVPGQVYMTDLNELSKSGKAPAHPVSREAFETAALAQLPPGDSSALAAHKGGEPTAPPPPPFVGDAGTGPGGTPVVTIYGTSWCGACRAAREYLTQRRVPFADKDVERDPAAARELSDKASKLGIPTDRVPIIDVRGRLLQGFDRARIDALLGEPT